MFSRPEIKKQAEIPEKEAKESHEKAMQGKIWNRNVGSMVWCLRSTYTIVLLKGTIIATWLCLHTNRIVFLIVLTCLVSSGIWHQAPVLQQG